MQTFRHLIEGDYLYIDKTKEIYEFFAGGGKYYFLSRPRRFGKSLLVSTLKEIFSGNKKLFQGLWIHDKIDWKPSPVIHIDFLQINSKTPEKLEKSLGKILRTSGNALGINLDPKSDYKDLFRELIVGVGRKNKNGVVILVDEYDKPIIDHVGAADKKTAKENRKILKNFYSTIKGSDEHLRFVLLTGVSKFSKVSVFSDLNNLRDITMSLDFATLMGYTDSELQHYFAAHIKTMADNLGVHRDKLLEKIRCWYNGYSWDGKNFLYNPLSILNLFAERRFENYWFSTGTPSFLINLTKEKNFSPEEFESTEADNSIFESFDIENMELVSLLFQTGYLTIKGKKESFDEETLYYLSYPNKEVRESFLKHLLKGYSEKELVGVGIDPKERNIKEYAVEPLPSSK